MLLEALFAAVVIALLSVVGVLFFGHDKRLLGIERYVVPVAVGVFLSLVLYELIPETLAASPDWGGGVILLGFLGFYVLSHKLHKRYHHLAVDECDKKGAAALLLVGDSVHNFSDGIILGGAFLIDPTVGFTTAVALALHEVPQEIVEFGVLLRAGYTRMEAVYRNLISASTIVLGVLVVSVLSVHAADFVWVLTGLAAGNLLYLAAGDLLPRIHGNLANYGGIWTTASSIFIAFAVMTGILVWSHSTFGHGAEGHTHGAAEVHGHDDEVHAHDDEETSEHSTDAHHDDEEHHDDHQEIGH